MKHLTKFFQAAAAAAILTASGGVALAQDNATALTGQWDAVLTRNGQEIPFRLDIKADGSNVQGVFYNGFSPYEGTTSASFKDGKLTLNVEHYLTTVNATLDGEKLVGDVATQGRESSAQYGFRATRHVAETATAAAAVAAPSIVGTWTIPLDTPSSKGEKAFRFVVEQRGAEVAAAILRVDGDTGAYSGVFKDGRWVLSHFDGGRPGVIVVTPKADGALEILQGDRAVRASTPTPANDYAALTVSDGRAAPVLTAYRPDIALAKGFAEPANFLTHTSARDPNEIFTFNFPDENGKLVSNEDPRFKGKVVVAVVTGTWCPNCHDEAQYLVQLDKDYRDKGLAIVALNFEEPEQQGKLTRQKAFIKQYGIKYTYLSAGSPAEMWEKVPQLNNLNTWPATVFVGRDGKVKAVHSGFASPSAGEFHTQLKQQFTARIEKLLAENVTVASADNAKPATVETTTIAAND